MLLTAIFPFSFFFGAVYTESTFLLFTLLSFYGFRTRRWALGGVAGAVATATRVTGIMMWPALAWIAWRTAKPTGRDRARGGRGAGGGDAGVRRLLRLHLRSHRPAAAVGDGADAVGERLSSGRRAVDARRSSWCSDSLTHPYAFLASEPMALYDTLRRDGAAVRGGDSVRLAAVRRGLRLVHAAESVCCRCRRARSKGWAATARCCSRRSSGSPRSDRGLSTRRSSCVFALFYTLGPGAVHDGPSAVLGTEDWG